MPGIYFFLEPSGRLSPVINKSFNEAFRSVTHRYKPEYPVDALGMSGKEGVEVATLIQGFSLEGALQLTAEFFMQSHLFQV
jgi:hypothetical protein